ncbi:hypothetical protein [Winogradskyella ursingii]|uniref:hypothetical protein n=1 Tax=Winogradskyella ursingii TaxID=2686079 RepID=UPI0015C771A8|nr:hypothetical protein [Winogradskyella ursingii]
MSSDPKPKKEDKKQNGKYFMNHRTPADMHGDGVYFNKELLAKKEQKEKQKKKTSN